MTKRKFYRTKITFSVLSDEPIPEECTEMSIIQDTMDGPLLHEWNTEREVTELNGQEAADACHVASSTPDFFMLDDDGNDTDEYSG